MSTQTQNARPGRSWLLEHILAVLTVGSFVYVYWLLQKVNLDADIEQLQTQLQLPASIVLAGTVSCLAAIWFWFRMFKDFVRNRPARHAAAWGLCLIIGAHLAALVYFVMVWRPRHAPL